MIQRSGWGLNWSLFHLSTKPKVIKIFKKSVQVMLKVVCCHLIRRSWQVHTVIKAFISENVAQGWLIFESLELKEEFFPFIFSWCWMKRTEKRPVKSTTGLYCLVAVTPGNIWTANNRHMNMTVGPWFGLFGMWTASNNRSPTKSLINYLISQIYSFSIMEKPVTEAKL